MPDSKNERLALLLGWVRGGWMERAGQGVYPVDGWVRGEEQTKECPNYTQWERFPEQQAFVFGLPVEQQLAIKEAVESGHEEHPELGWLYITPDILADAILEVCNA
jgi:hypothetical protein